MRSWPDRSWPDSGVLMPPPPDTACALSGDSSRTAAAAAAAATVWLLLCCWCCWPCKPTQQWRDHQDGRHSRQVGRHWLQHTTCALLCVTRIHTHALGVGACVLVVAASMQCCSWQLCVISLYIPHLGPTQHHTSTSPCMHASHNISSGVRGVPAQPGRFASKRVLRNIREAGNARDVLHREGQGGRTAVKAIWDRSLSLPVARWCRCS